MLLFLLTLQLRLRLGLTAKLRTPVWELPLSNGSLVLGNLELFSQENLLLPSALIVPTIVILLLCTKRYGIFDPSQKARILKSLWIISLYLSRSRSELRKILFVNNVSCLIFRSLQLKSNFNQVLRTLLQTLCPA